MQDDEFGPVYKDITESVKYVVYGVDMDREYGELTEKLPIEELRRIWHSYNLREGNSVLGSIKEIKSCASAPRVLVQIRDQNTKLSYLEGLLIGEPKNLGVALIDVLDIKKVTTSG